jgi:CBS domain-containing protein
MRKLVRELMVRKLVKIREDEPIYQAVEKIAADRETLIACVVDKDGKLKGIITPRELLKTVEVREFETVRYPFFEASAILGLLTSKYAKDIMCAPRSVREDEEVENAIYIMLDCGFCEVPVVDQEGRVIGEINYLDIITSSIDYLKQE